MLVVELGTFFLIALGRVLISGLRGQVHLSRLFSIREASGIRIRIVMKYIMDATWPIVVRG